MKRAEDICGRSPGQESEKTRTRSAEPGPHLAQTVLQEALFDVAGRQGHRGVKFSGRVARAAQPAQVVRQGSVPEMGVLQAGDGLQGSQARLGAVALGTATARLSATTGLAVIDPSRS